MRTSSMVLAMAAMSSVVLFGCATMSDVLKSKNEGTAQTYAVGSDRAWEIAMTVLRWEGCETIEEHRSSGYMLTTFGQDFVSSGCLVGVWVDPIDKGNTRVTVVTKRKIQTNLATGMTESTFQRRFAQAVQIVQRREPLPIEPPAEQTD